MTRSLVLTTIISLSVTVAVAISGAGATNFLLTGQTLSGGQSLTYQDYSLTLGRDGNLILFNGSTPIWTTLTLGLGVTLTLSNSGELTLNLPPPFKLSIWSSKKKSTVTGIYALVIRYDGSLVIYGPIIWKAGAAAAAAGISSPATSPAVSVIETTDSVLYSGDVAPIGTTVVGGNFKLVLREDCDLVLGNFNVNDVKWSSGSSAPWKDCFVNLESSGQLRVKYLGGAVLWDSVNSGESDEYVLIIGSGGDLAVYGPRLWTNKAASAAAAATAAISMVTERSNSL